MQNFRYQQDLSATGNCAGVVGNREAILDIGSLWDRMGLVRQLGISNPVYVGRNTAEEWRLLIDAKERVAVPVANLGGPGSEWNHWRESVLLNELMTPSLNTGAKPIGRVAIASLRDMGYQVDLQRADVFQLPSPSALVSFGAGPDDEVVTRCSCGSLQRPPIRPIEVPEQT